MSNTTLVLLGALVAFVLSGIAARILGPEKFGLATYILSMSGLLSVVCSFGYQFKFSKIQRQHIIDRKEFHKASSLSLIALILLIPILLIYSFINHSSQLIIFISIIHAAAYILVEQIYYYYNSTGLSLKAAFHKSIIPKFLPLALVSMFYFYNVNMTAEQYLYFLILGLITVCLANIHLFKLTLPTFKYINDIKNIYTVQLLYFCPSLLLRILYVEIASLTALAYLAIGLMFTQVINLLGMSICNQLAPNLRTSIRQSDSKKISSILNDTAFYPTILMLPIIVALFYNFELLINILGDQYQTNTASLIIYSILAGAIFNILTGATGTILMLSSFVKLELYTGITKAVMVWAIFFVVQFYSPILSVPIALTSGELIANLIKAIQVKKYFNTWPWSKEKLLIAFGALIIMIAASEIISSIAYTESLSFILSIIATTLIMCSALILNRRMI
ncbi:oligosaccharide flippase family protein [Octadecabacter sp.]|nr:oligosaccharide flippase family protein [Octadecabacter sp.]